MAKIFEGKIVSLKMQNTALVEVLRRVPHPMYKKILKRTKNHKADTAGIALVVGDRVKIVEVRPLSKDKHFKILEKIK
jgi:small subunit ribosomal protein S17